MAADRKAAAARPRLRPSLRLSCGPSTKLERPVTLPRLIPALVHDRPRRVMVALVTASEAVRIEVPSTRLSMVIRVEAQLEGIGLRARLKGPVTLPRLAPALMHERIRRVLVAVSRPNPVRIEVPSARLRVVVRHEAQLVRAGD